MLREATVDDIEAMHRIRLGVMENRLSDPSRVTSQHYRAYLERDGRGWVEVEEGIVRGFAIADRTQRHVWALFVAPECEGRGVGQALLGAMTQWLFAQGAGAITLTTEPDTRAARFYLAAGWQSAGVAPNGELRFELPPPHQL